MKILISFCLLAFGLSSCLVRFVTGNDYKYLHPSYQAIISKTNTFDGLDNKKVYEINGLQLKEELAKYDSSLVHFHNIRCSGPSCVPLAVYENYAEKHNLKLFVILITYSNIHEAYEQAFNAPLFGIDVEYYGVNKYKVYIPSFKKDLVGNNDEIHDILIFHKAVLARNINTITAM